MAANTKPTMLFFLLSFAALSNVRVFGQSNYASHGNNINYIGNGLPEETVLDGKVSDIELSVVERHFCSVAWATAITVTSQNALGDFSCLLCQLNSESRELMKIPLRTNSND